MAETNKPNPEQPDKDLFAQLSSDETLEITIRKETNEVILRNPKDGRIVKLKANFEETVKRPDEVVRNERNRPLTPEEFEDGLRNLDKIGLTFSVDLSPKIIARDEQAGELLDEKEFRRVRERYPHLPREVGLVAHNTLTGDKNGLPSLGGLESFEKKSAIVTALVLTDKYREDFFFRHALKVPYLANIDWEIVMKTHERGVAGRVGTPYAMLMLKFHHAPHSESTDEFFTETVAVNRDLIDDHLAALAEVRKALEDSFKVQDVLRERLLSLSD